MEIDNILTSLEESLQYLEERSYYKVSANKQKQYGKTLMKTCAKGMEYNKAEQRCVLMSSDRKQALKLISRKSARTRRILMRNAAYKTRVTRKTKKTLRYRKMLVGSRH